MAKFRKKPLVIDAVQWFKPGDHPAVQTTVVTNSKEPLVTSRTAHFIQTLEGPMQVQPGDWIVTGIKGEYYAVKDDIFKATYESAEGNPWNAATTLAQIDAGTEKEIRIVEDDGCYVVLTKKEGELFAPTWWINRKIKKLLEALPTPRK